MLIVDKVLNNWIYFFNSDAQKNKSDIELELKKPNHGSVGKYLFFSDNKHVLIDLAKDILKKYNLYSAKVPLSNVPMPSKGFGFVLCVYDSKPNFKHEFKQFASNSLINYRYWKSDERTLKGEYSDQFLLSNNDK